MKKKDKVKGHGFLKFILVLIIICAGTYYYARYVGTTGLVIKEYSVINEKIPESFHGFKIVQFSDTHYGMTTFNDELKNMVSKINILNPDIVVFTGDLVDYHYNLNDDEKNDIINILSEIDASLGVYAVSGNHDQNVSYEGILSGSNINLLKNKYEYIYNGTSEKIMLIGLDDYLEGTLDLDAAFSYEDDTSYKILLSHEPDVYDKLPKTPDLMLAGHSHNGQVRIPLAGAIYKTIGAKKYYDPEYSLGDTKMYISGGVGTSKYKVRLFDRPSISLYRLYSK